MFAGHWVCQGVAVFLCLGACLFVSAVSTHSWLFVTGICGIAVLLYASLAYAKFEIWDGGFSHRSLSGNHVFEFVQIEDALFETENVDDGYAPVFSLRLKGEVRRNKIPIGHVRPSRRRSPVYGAGALWNSYPAGWKRDGGKVDPTNPRSTTRRQ